MPGASLQHWYEALGSAFGIVIETSDPERYRQRMYALRKEASDPMLEGISIVISPTNPASHVWLVKKGSNSETP